jgi:prevent-host-death family protein
MRHVSVAEAKAKFSEIIQAVEAGEDIRITRHGTAVVRLVAEQVLNDRPIDIVRLKRWQLQTPPSSATAAEIMRAERDAD